MSDRVTVRVGDTLLADSTRAVRVLETASAPTWYLPPDDVQQLLLVDDGGQSLCEWKGLAQGFSAHGIANIGWRYVRVFSEFANLRNWCAFYPSRAECYVGGERMGAQPGGFYGGWVAANMTGPIKGEPGSSGW